MKIMPLVFLLMITSAWSQNRSLTGKIVNNSNKGLKYVTVKIKDTEQQVLTDDTGTFVFNDMSTGAIELDIEISQTQHYNTVVNNDGETIVINVDAMRLDDIVISALPLEHSLLEMTTPVAILDEQELVLLRGTSLDQTINKIPGVNSGSFGNGAGQVVIRGQQGPRVTILNNNQTLQDASRVSPDHWITTEPLLAKQIEVLKGPATLLYGGGAIGGVVNVVDDVIPTKKTEGIKGAFEGRISDSTLDERANVIKLDAGISENFMAHLSHFNSKTDDYEIPGFAESAALMATEEHEEGEEEEAFGVLENSSINSDGTNFGLSRVNDNGYWGLSYSDFNRDYGLPGHGHEEEEGHDDEEEEEVRLGLDKSVLTIKGLHSFDGSTVVDHIKTHYSDTDYRHVEFEGNETGTVFDNQASEFRFEMGHKSIQGFEGIVGLQYINREFSAIGDEAFIIPSTTKTLSLFLIEERNFEGWHGEFGLRFEDQNVETALFQDISDQALSVSLGAAIDLSESWTLPINLSSAQRLPSAEEYLSNQNGSDELITHLATSVIEVGDIDLTHETANVIDIGLKYRNNNIRFDAALFYNSIDDYIFLRNTGEFFEEVPIFQYTQQNATFYGYEIEFAYDLTMNDKQNWRFKAFTDSTAAELKNGEAVPRIPSERVGLGIDWYAGPWSIGINHTHVRDQDDLADFEFPTEGYELLDMHVSWLYNSARWEALVFLKGNNLLDEEIRDHASFIKDLAPRPGRSLSAGLRVNF